MDENFAKKLIRDTLPQPFNKKQFIGFIKELLNEIDESKAFYARGYIPEIFKNYIKTYERIGTYLAPQNKKIDILIVYLQQETTLARARTAQRNFIARYLRDRGRKDAGLIAFVSPAPEDWRFSFVKMEYTLVKTPKGDVKPREELTPARRYSFLVGKNENSHTAQKQLLPILQDDQNNPSFSQIENIFNIEVVTKEFFGKYRELFLKTKEEVEKIIEKDETVKKDFAAKEVSAIDFSKKLLGQIVFLYFLQKKGWFGVPRGKDWGEGDKKFLRNLFDIAKKENKNYFNKFLEPLFYEALRLERPKNYYDKFSCRIPFLNGGLFDPINDYDWQDTDIEIPNEIFSNKCKTKDGDTGNGILDVFDRYNFTVKEDEPLEREVAVDPEMLGKVFENLLEVKDRKSKGTYYTPREIVHYMCQESLINYLTTELSSSLFLERGQDEGDVIASDISPSPLVGEGKGEGGSVIASEAKQSPIPTKEDIETLIKYGESVVEHDSRVVSKGRETKDYSFKLPESVRKHANLIDEKLKTIRVCDPAVGSGAFPVGMMNEIIRARNTLTPYVFPSPLLVPFRVMGEGRGEGEKVTKRTSYHFKRHAIQNCLYGVDIDPGAVEIAKLRLWLSLIVDEEDIKQIKPLPNLDYKIVCGNSLLGVEKDLFNNELFKKLEELKPLYFNETNVRKKEGYKKQIDNLIREITNNNENFDFEVYFSEVFHEKDGFDVVIANPPYLEARSPEFSEKMKEEAQRGAKSRWGEDSEYITRGSDILIYFLELGTYLLTDKGSLVFITQNSWLDTNYGKKFQSFLLRHTNVKAIVDSDFKYFDSKLGPNINTVISIFVGKKADEENVTIFARYHEDFEKVVHSILCDEVNPSPSEIEIKKFKYDDQILRTLKWGTLLSSSEEALSLFSLIEKKGNRLNQLLNYDLSIGQGLNIQKSLVVKNNIIEKFPFLDKRLIPFMTTEDGAPFVLEETAGSIIDGSQLDKNEIKKLKSADVDVFKPDSTGKIRPALIMPRGISRHFCVLNSISAYSSSGVDIYDNKGNLPEEMRLNLWLFLNSSIAWLIREITGRKSLGGGLLKAEATDLREMPIYFDFRRANDIKKIYEKLRERKALPTIEEIDTPEHKKIDEIVFDYLEIPRKKIEIVVELLRKHVLGRITKSRT